MKFVINVTKKPKLSCSSQGSHHVSLNLGEDLWPSQPTTSSSRQSMIIRTANSEAQSRTEKKAVLHPNISFIIYRNVCDLIWKHIDEMSHYLPFLANSSQFRRIAAKSPRLKIQVNFFGESACPIVCPDPREVLAPGGGDL